MSAPPLRLALGLGCDRGTPAATIAGAVDAALADVALSHRGAPLSVERVASIDLKADESGLIELVAVRGWTIVFYSAARLADVPVPNPSATVLRHTGTPSVAEAAALLAAGLAGQDCRGPDATSHVAGEALAANHPPAPPAPMSHLLIEKLRRRGPDGRHATVSIARIV